MRYAANRVLVLAIVMALPGRPAFADSVDAPALAGLETVSVVAQGISNMTAASAGEVTREELASQPLLRPAAILENVPGLIVTQHSGEGKANQYFLRAFNLDHGTLRYHQGSSSDFLTVTAMAYSGRWNATDQVPERAIDSGLIDRFGSLNPTDGGTTSRASLSLNRVLRTDAAQTQLSAYVVRYRLDLWSTFTYFLQDPVHGDQMLQHDDRIVYGLKGSRTWYTSLWGLSMSNVLGVQARVDDIRGVGIDHTFERRYLSTTQNAGVLEASGAVYLENATQWLTHLRTVVGLRGDEFSFDVQDKMHNPDGTCDLRSDPLGCNTGNVRAHIFSPKLGIVAGPWGTTTYFVTVADGYHSNDARGVTRSGENPDAQPVTPLTRATSAEAGLSADVLAGAWHTTLDIFRLKLRSELVFDGDAGVTTPSGATTRMGIEWGNTFRINDWLRADLNAALSKARFDQNVSADDLGCGNAAPEHPCSSTMAISGRYIPNSPTSVIDAGVTAGQPSGWFGSLRMRHFGESALVEDNSARSPAYTTFDLQLGYQRPGRRLLAIDTFNLFNLKWNDIEYYYVSRLQNEPAPRPDFVVHPGVPRTLRARFQYFF